MKVYLNELNGLWNAIDAMYFSRRSWSREFELKVMEAYERNFDRWGKRKGEIDDEMQNYINLLFKWSTDHITLAKFFDFSFTIDGLHRGAQDDFDSHAKRMDNRIIRASTRLAKFGNEKSDWYEGKIFSTDEVLEKCEIQKPAEVIIDGINYVSTVNGYVREDLKNNKDVLRGLYMLSIPSTFTFKCNCTEFAHIVKERDQLSHAAPELRDMIEECKRQIRENIPNLTDEFYYKVKN